MAIYKDVPDEKNAVFGTLLKAGGAAIGGYLGGIHGAQAGYGAGQVAGAAIQGSGRPKYSLRRNRPFYEGRQERDLAAGAQNIFSGLQGIQLSSAQEKKLEVSQLKRMLAQGVPDHMRAQVMQRAQSAGMDMDTVMAMLGGASAPPPAVGLPAPLPGYNPDPAPEGGSARAAPIVTGKVEYDREKVARQLKGLGALSKSIKFKS